MWLERAARLLQDGGAVMSVLVLLAFLVGWVLGLRALTLGPWALRQAQRQLSKAELPSVARTQILASWSEGRTVARTLAGAAPLLGLFGTVDGMIETFDALGQGAMHRASGGIAGGISVALLTTQLGLCVAIPATLVGRMLERREENLARALDALPSPQRVSA
jgi:biopolymer transport protein ExbB